MKSAKILFLTCALFLTSASLSLASPSTQPVIGGTNASKNYPWMAALLFSDVADSTEAQFCGATLIAPQYLATAAHCVSSFGEVIEASSIEVMLGENILPFGRGNRLPVIGVLAHPNYDDVTIENDVALIKLEKPVTTPFLRVLQPGEESLVSEGKSAKLLGWGATHPNLPILPINLQEVEIPVRSDANCLASIGRWFKPLSMLCAGVRSSSSSVIDGKDSCFGDSGGPLVVSSPNGDALAATVSWGLGCANSLTYGVYADAIQLASFLNSRPIARPLVKGNLTVEGSGIAGEPLRCVDTALLVSGDPVSNKTYKWFSSYGDYLTPLATTQTYVPNEFDIDSFISCQAEFSNAGGTSVVTSSNDAYITGIVATPAPSPSPTIEPRVDSNVPIVKAVSKKCRKNVCKVIVEAQDESGVLSVEAFYNRSVKASSSCKGSGCIRSSSGTLSASAIDGSRWLFTIKAPRKGILKLQLQVRALDTVGNFTTDGAVVVLKYKGSTR